MQPQGTGQEEAPGRRGRARLYVHHDHKSGGEHGQAIAGAGAFLGIVDRALEVRFDTHDKQRRRIVVHSRIATVGDLLYELRDVTLRPLGDPAAVSLEAVRTSLLEVVGDTWLKASDLRELLDDPKLSARQIREALAGLWASGNVERDPPEEKRGAAYHYRAAAALRAAAQPDLARESPLVPGSLSPHMNGSGGDGRGQVPAPGLGLEVEAPQPRGAGDEPEADP